MKIATIRPHPPGSTVSAQMARRAGSGLAQVNAAMAAFTTEIPRKGSVPVGQFRWQRDTGIRVSRWNLQK